MSVHSPSGGTRLVSTSVQARIGACVRSAIVVIPLAVVVASCSSPHPRDIVAESSAFADVRDILDEYCVECHSAEDPAAELVLETHTGIVRGGENGPVLIAGNAEESRIIRMLEQREKPFMPMKSQGRRRVVPPEDIAILRAWIDAGARTR